LDASFLRLVEQKGWLDTNIWNQKKINFILSGLFFLLARLHAIQHLAFCWEGLF